LKLTARLQSIVEFVQKNSIVADIGTDHGYIPKYLIDMEISKLVIASDISKGSLDKTISYLEEENLSEYIMPRLGNGLEVIKPFEVDTIIIAGMGGLLITEILENDKKKLDSYLDYILQPMVGADELRKYLLNNHFSILQEKIVKEGNKYYEIIHARRGLQEVSSDIEYEISPLWLESEDSIWKEMINIRLLALESIHNDLEDKDSERSKERFIQLKEKISKYKEVLKIEG